MRSRGCCSAAAAVAVLFLISLPAVTTRFYASDELQFFAWLRSVAFDRDADFTNEYQYFYDTGPGRNAGFRDTFLDSANEAGRRRNFAPVGAPILWAPFYAAGHVVALATGAPADGLSHPYVAAVDYASAIYGALALMLTIAIVRRVMGPPRDRRFDARAFGAAILVWAGTPLAFYMYVAPGFAHACSAFAVALFVWIWLRVRVRWSAAGAIALGLAGALVAMVREQDVLFVAGPALDVARTWWRARRDSVAVPPIGAAAAVAGVVAFAIGYAPQLAAYQALNGHPSATTDVTRKLTWWSPHFFGVLLSPEHGLVFWTPLVVIAIAGLLWLASGRTPASHPDAAWIGVLAIVMFLLQAYISGCVESWTVAGSFGQRRFLGTTPLLALGLAAAFASARTRAVRAALAVVVVLCVWWHAGLMMQFGLHTMDRQRLTLAANARATFLDLPRDAPSLVWRYLSDRASFYGK